MSFNEEQPEMMHQDNTHLFRSPEGYQAVMSYYDEVLDQLDINLEVVSIETSYGKTHVLTGGNDKGKPLVLFHGLNANSGSWAAWIPYLALDYRLYAVDTIGGMGRSAQQRPSKKDLSYGVWAAETLQGLNLSTANMFGASNGGWLILKLSNVAPETISSAVLMSTAGLSRVNLLQSLRMLPAIVFNPPDKAADKLLATISGPEAPPDRANAKLLELMIRHFRSEQLAPILEDDEVRQLTAPTCLLMGQHEVSVDPYKTVKRGLELLPNLISAEIVQGVGHSMVHKEPEFVVSKVLNFLEKNAS